MFHTGQANSGKNEIPNDLKTLQPLCRQTSDLMCISSNTRRAHPKELDQFPLYMLPYTVNNNRFDLVNRECSAGSTLFEIAQEAMLDQNTLEYHIAVIQTSDVVDEALSISFPGEGWVLQPIQVCEILRMSPASMTPIVAVKGRSIIIVVSKDVFPLLWLNISAMLPHLFPDMLKNATYPVSPKLFNALGTRKYSVWSEMLLAWATPIMDEFVKKQNEIAIRTFFSNVKQNTLKKYEDKLIMVRRNMTDLLAEYDRQLQEEREILGQALVAATVQRDMSDAIDYWLTKKEIISVEIQASNILKLNILTPVINYDEDELATMLSTSASNSMNSQAWRRRFFRKLFIDRTHQLWCRVTCAINFESHNIQKADEDDTTSKTLGIPNPHIDNFNCWGGNKPLISKMSMEQNYEMAIEQIIAACANLNFSDPTVMKYLTERLHAGDYDNIQAITRKDGTRMTIKEFKDEECMK